MPAPAARCSHHCAWVRPCSPAPASSETLPSGLWLLFGNPGRLVPEDPGTWASGFSYPQQQGAAAPSAFFPEPRGPDPQLSPDSDPGVEDPHLFPIPISEPRSPGPQYLLPQDPRVWSPTPVSPQLQSWMTRPCVAVASVWPWPWPGSRSTGSLRSQPRPEWK